ncbi:MAG: hypothetical protein NVS3B10_00590 [Polyangiales bacterium]
MTKAILTTLAISFAVSCTDETASRRALEDSGYTEVRFTGYVAFSCGRDDNFSTGFVAKNPAGRTVSGVVCCGLFKSCTVRF